MPPEWAPAIICLGHGWPPTARMPDRVHPEGDPGSTMTTTRKSNFAAAFRTTILMATLTGLLVVIGALIGGASTALTFLFLAALLNLGAWFFSDKLALRMSGAQPVTEEQAPGL